MSLFRRLSTRGSKCIHFTRASEQSCADSSAHVCERLHKLRRVKASAPGLLPPRKTGTTTSLKAKSRDKPLQSAAATMPAPVARGIAGDVSGKRVHDQAQQRCLPAWHTSRTRPCRTICVRRRCGLETGRARGSAPAVLAMYLSVWHHARDAGDKKPGPIVEESMG
jgi:hypothetical protein